MAKILSIVERAYHGTIEEQDDTALWMSGALKSAGGDITVLLRGNAVNYGCRGQDASGLVIGGTPLKVPPTIDQDVSDLLSKGVEVYAVEEDLVARGIDRGSLVQGIRVVKQAEVAKLWDSHGAVWHW